MNVLEELERERARCRELEARLAAVQSEGAGMSDSKSTAETLEAQKAEAQAALLTLMKDESNDHFYIRGVLERLIEKIDERLREIYE